ADRIRRHVAEYDVGRSAKHFLQPRRRGFVKEVELCKLDMRDGLDLEQVDRNDAATARSGFHALGRDLTPTAGRGAEIEHLLAGLEQTVLVVDLDQLVGGA